MPAAGASPTGDKGPGGRVGAHQVTWPQGGDPTVLTAPPPPTYTPGGAKGSPALLTSQMINFPQVRGSCRPSGSPPPVLVPAQGPACHWATPQLPPSPGIQFSWEGGSSGGPGQFCWGRETASTVRAQGGGFQEAEGDRKTIRATVDQDLPWPRCPKHFLPPHF